MTAAIAFLRANSRFIVPVESGCARHILEAAGVALIKHIAKRKARAKSYGHGKRCPLQVPGNSDHKPTFPFLSDSEGISAENLLADDISGTLKRTETFENRVACLAMPGFHVDLLHEKRHDTWV